jgi:hypothetical protein
MYVAGISKKWAFSQIWIGKMYFKTELFSLSGHRVCRVKYTLLIYLYFIVYTSNGMVGA